MESIMNGHLAPKVRLEHRNVLAHLRACGKWISIQITFQFLIPFLQESMQGRQRTHLSSGLGRALVKYRTNGAGRYTYDRRFYLPFRRHFEYVLPSTRVLLRFYFATARRFFLYEDWKAPWSCLRDDVIARRAVKWFLRRIAQEGIKRSRTFGNPITENTRETILNESYSTWP